MALPLASSGNASADDGKIKPKDFTATLPSKPAGSSVSVQNTNTASTSNKNAQNELAAAQAYDRGAAAFDAKDYARAADEFSRADTLAPNTLALQLALDSAMRAGRAAMVMDLTTRAEARLSQSPASSDRTVLTGLISRAHAEYEVRTGTLTIQCAAQHTCAAQVDDRPWPVNARTWIGVGRHVLSMKIDGREDHRDVVIASREQVEVRPDPAAPAPLQGANVAHNPISKDPMSYPVGQGQNQGNPGGSRHMSPTWFWVGAATTAVLGGLTIASGIDTNAKHDEFELNRTADRASEGRGAQTRTNVLLGLTAIGAVATATLAVFFVDWSHSRTPGRASGPRTTLGLGSCLTLTTTY
ncbi:hypothetical protein LZC95_39110 [Pendulispora brunnea]|uniref:Tetratricopeptide repeat protein n=1 Tax=Pendulispora brunnea TaxID=2905690 RepID=A0ABZ2K130_9BACT